MGRDPTDAELYERLHTSNKKPVSSVTGPPMDPRPSYVHPKAAKKKVEETYVGSNPNTTPVDHPELSECSVVGRHKDRLVEFCTDKDPRFAMNGDPNAVSSRKRSYDNHSAEVNALKEKLASYEDLLETEKRKRLALEQQHKETTNELARQKALTEKALTEQFLAIKRQFQQIFKR